MKQKKIYLSLARLICAFAVIVIHTNTCFQEFNLNDCWIHSNFIECGLSFAVPIFLMLTGATLIDYSDRYSTKKYFINRIHKTGIPYVAWMLIAFIYVKYTGNAECYVIYMFFLYLFGIYLCIPLFSFIKPSHKDKVITYVVVISFIFNYLFPFLSSILHYVNPFLVIPVEIASNYLIYPLVGYLICKKQIPFRWRVIWYLCSFIGFVIQIGGTYFFSVKEGAIVHLFKGYTNVPTFLISVGVLVFIKQIGIKIKEGYLSKVIDWLSEYTFAIYLIHYYVIKEIIEPLFVNTHSLEYKLFTPFLTFFICLGMAWIIKKIPILRRILP